MPPPLLTVIVAVFNGAKTLQQCIDSVAQQTYPNKELIIIDGGSKDGTVDLLEANREKFSYWISESDRGIYSAWNKGLAHAKGEWICFLGADDFFWDAQVLGRMAGQLEKLPPSIRVAYGKIMVLDTRGESLYPVGEPWEKIKKRFRQVMCIPHPGLMHRRSLFEQHGRFDESFRIAGDYELLSRELPMADAFFFPNIIVVGMRQGGVSSTTANLLVALNEIRHVQQIHGCLPPWYIRSMAMTSALLRLFLLKIFGERRIRKMINWFK